VYPNDEAGMQVSMTILEPPVDTASAEGSGPPKPLSGDGIQDADSVGIWGTLDHRWVISKVGTIVKANGQ